MKIVKHDPSSAIPGQTPIVLGDVANQVLVSEVDARDLRITSVTFRDGARNRFHRHSCDQVLVIVDGRGIVATVDETIEIEQGDVIIVPAGELHWHGAAPGESMTHLSIVTPHDTTFEEPDAIEVSLESFANAR